MTVRVSAADLEAAVKRLDEVLKPIARRPVDITQPGWEKEFESYDPLEEAGIRREAQDLLARMVAHYGEASESERARLRDLFDGQRAFAWAATLPDRPTSALLFRQHLLHFSLEDQGTDARDAIVKLNGLCAEAKAAGVETGPILRAVAELSSNIDKYGMGSTASQLKQAI